MSTPLRSTTGCASCKTKRKKCDETKPQCLRCLASGRSCVYEYVDYPERGGNRVKRTKPAPRATKGLAVAIRHTQGDDLALPNFAIGMSTVPPNLETQSNEFYYEPNTAVTHASSTFLSLTSTPRGHLLQPLSGPNPSSSSPALDFVLPLSFDTPAATDPTFQYSAIPPDEDDGDSDPERVQSLLCKTLTVDKNVRDNALPFVLLCYSRWAIARVFEPLKIAHVSREQVVAQFSSETTRTRTILIANVMDLFARKLAIDSSRKYILDRLVSDTRRRASSFVATPPSASGLDRYNAMRILDSAMELFSLQIFTQPFANSIQSLDHAAPIFRRACLDPSGHPVNLANIVLESNFSLLCFANLDIIHSVTTGRPTYFQYEVPFSLELCEQLSCLQESHTLRWYLGFPIQFFLMFAWIGSLCRIPGAGNNSELIAWIESNLPHIEVTIDESDDPILRIGRIVVRECWRSVVLIYLYLTLCNANADDPRIVRAQKGFMRLIRGIKPRRNPDAHLAPTLVIAGLVSTKERDQDTIRQRILGVQEFRERGTVGNDYMLQLEDVWARTRDEGRPPVWSDLRIASFKVTGR